MSYRDDRDALDRRVKNLEDDLRVAKEELAEKADDGERAKKIAAMDAHMAQARRELEKMGHELDELRGKPKPANGSRIALLFAVATVTVVAGAVFFLRATESTQIPISPPTPTSLVAVPVPVPTPMPPPVPDAPAPQHIDERTTTVQWRGKVTFTKGSPLTVGAPCTADALLKTTGKDMHVSTLDVTCGGKAIYRSTDKLEGTSMTRGGGEEILDTSSSHPRYILVYEDVGSRTAERSQVSVDTSKGVGAAWSETMPASRVEFSLNGWSEASNSGPLLDLNQHAVRRKATVERIEGIGSPAKLHADCAMVAYPYLGKGDQCIVRVSCGSTFLYGSPGEGIAACALKNGEVASASDTQPSGATGDPMLDLDVAGGTVVVSDGPDNHRWAAHLKLTDLPQ